MTKLPIENVKKLMTFFLTLYQFLVLLTVAMVDLHGSRLAYRPGRRQRPRSSLAVGRWNIAFRS